MAENEYKDNDLALAELTNIYNQRLQKVRKSNDLVLKANFDLTTTQNHIILYIISKIKPDDTNFQDITFSIKDYAKIIGIKFDGIGGSAYENIKDSLQQLADKSRWITLVGNNNKDVLIRWLDRIEIDKGTGEITVRLNFDLKPYLLQLTKNYTEYTLINPLTLKSAYSIRLYELLKAVHYNKELPYEAMISLENLKNQIGVFSEYYNTYANFSKKILNKALEEINTKTDIYVTYKPKRTGRKVSHIIFHLESKEGVELLQQVNNNQLELSKYFE